MMKNFKKIGEWEIHLTIKLKFMSSTGSNEKRTMYSKSNNSIAIIGNDTDKIIQKLFDSLLHKHQINLRGK